MRVLISTVVWGSRYVRMLCDYSLASQLAPNNLPRLAQDHEVTYHIVTTRRDRRKLEADPTLRAIAQNATIVFEEIESHGFHRLCIPPGNSPEKYAFLSRLQNIAIEASLDHDLIIFNYADFVWADGSLNNTVVQAGGTDALLSFCLPVDGERGRTALQVFRSDTPPHAITMPPRDGAGLAIDNLHRETRLRYWDGPAFTSLPSYILWPVADAGVLIRAYHQTVLALRVRPDAESYRAGITCGSLDGYFTAILADEGSVRHAAQSDDIFVFSLYDSETDSRAPAHRTRDSIMRDLLTLVVSEGQRRFAEVPLYVVRDDLPEAEAATVTASSAETLRRFHEAIPPDRAIFEANYAHMADITTHEPLWRARSPLRRLGIWTYRRASTGLTTGRTAAVIKTILGHRMSRGLRRAVEKLVMPKPT